ncbi:MAG: hypothetical protein HWD92_01605 [Flavobacteriia bacterium]|nr:hypothetical protein [Flavobacteriia bacterium]
MKILKRFTKSMLEKFVPSNPQSALSMLTNSFQIFSSHLPAKWEETLAGCEVFKRVPDDDSQTIKEYPVISGSMPPNGTLVVFNLNKAKVFGSTDMAGISLQPGENFTIHIDDLIQ